jgi:hypothetical protein
MKVDRVLGLGALLVAIPVALAAWGFGLGTPKSPGAGFWPLLIALAMAGLGVSLLLRPGADATREAGRPRWRKLALTLVTLAFYAVALEPLGYLPATFMLLLMQLRWVESRPWRGSAAVALVAAVVSLVLFRVLLKVPLPVGVIPLPGGW